MLVAFSLGDRLLSDDPPCMIRQLVDESPRAMTEAWAGQKGSQRKNGEPPADGVSHFHGQRRANEAHASVSDPKVRPYRKSQGQKVWLPIGSSDLRKAQRDSAFTGMLLTR
jgi:hypothetical protein